MDRDCTQRHVALKTPSMLTSSGPELLFLSLFVIESRNVDVSGRNWLQTQTEDRQEFKVAMSK